MYMDNYIGKHLLVDCYGCRPSSIDSSPDLLAAMIDAAEKIGMTCLPAALLCSRGYLQL